MTIHNQLKGLSLLALLLSFTEPVTAQDSTSAAVKMSRSEKQARIAEHQDRIERIIEESNRRKAEGGVTTQVRSLQSTGVAVRTSLDAESTGPESHADRQARIIDHQNRIQRIIDESRLRKAEGGVTTQGRSLHTTGVVERNRLDIISTGTGRYADREARILEHQIRIEDIIENARRRKAEQEQSTGTSESE